MIPPRAVHTAGVIRSILLGIDTIAIALRPILEPPGVGGADAPAVDGLQACVLLVGAAVLGRIAGCVEQLEIPVRQRGAQLLQLVRVLRAEPET